MSVVRTFFPEIRLKRLMSEPGGIRASEALRRAEAGLESIRDACVAALDLKIEALAALPDQLDSLEAAYRLANEIFAEAGTFDLNELSAAAYNLCQALAPRMPSGPFPPEVVRVHVHARSAHSGSCDKPSASIRNLGGIAEARTKGSWLGAQSRRCLGPARGRSDLHRIRGRPC